MNFLKLFRYWEISSNINNLRYKVSKWIKHSNRDNNIKWVIFIYAKLKFFVFFLVN